MDPVTFAEVVPGRLYFGAIKGGAPKSTENTYYFCTDNTLAYEPFFKDFGPLSMGQVYRFCVFLRKTMDVRFCAALAVFVLLMLPLVGSKFC
mmetsp:Transcript_6092/g.14956  ORF Transcript_6092/g.14956 Transcript_6092/m.14956 type:complete len:92 (+) Transcript_6092:70-345(+)